jgi:hypothetical protein
MRLKSMRNVGIVATVMTLDAESMAGITRRSIMVAVARMRITARNSIKLLVGLMAGMVSLQERDLRRNVRNLAAEAGSAVDMKDERELQKRDVRSLVVEVASEVDIKNLLVNASKNAERNMAVVEASVADTRNHQDKNTEVVVSGMKLVGVRESVRMLLRREKRSAKRSIERRDRKRVVVDGSLD